MQKKAYDDWGITPIHIAAVNPDPTIFKRMFKTYPTVLIHDNQQRDIVHYAACNKNSEVLEYLISKKVDINSSK